MSRYGSDLIVDLLVEAGVEHVALNPGATFRGIQDSIVQRDDGPALALCMHEAVAVAVAHGYAKAAGRPMAALLHNVVGLQNASMAVYNAWCDRAPILLIGGTGPKSKSERRPWIDWIHTANAQGEAVRDFVKWDDEPHDAASIGESFARALGAARSEPQGPVYLCYDVALQEDELPAGVAPPALDRYPTPSAPAPAEAEAERMLELLLAAERPLIIAGYAGGDAAAMESLGRLAAALGAAVIDTGVRFPLASDHPHNATGVEGVLEEADVVLALDVDDLQLRLGPRAGDERLTVLAAGLGNLRLRGWSHDYQALVPAAISVTASAATTVAALLRLLGDREADGAAERGGELGERVARARAGWRDEAGAATADGAVPLPRLLRELGAALGERPFRLASGTNGRLEHRLWSLREPRQYLGWHGGGGLGYGAGATIGCALGSEPGVISVDVQADGDLLYLPSALWTAVHLGLPALFVVNDNRQYGNTVEHAIRIAEQRGRGDRRYAGAGLADPPVDIASMASSFGLWARGPVSEVAELQETLAEAVAVAASGRPALVDVLTPGF
ncbi:MAG: thiamine pyrophosphate-binding protein [Actinobacteria bacterium]|nr:thiamine pyrophosphate-binding protein [Actinomycetota bacterium]